MIHPIEKTFYKQDALKVAKDMLGKTLIRETEEQCYYYKIVETEAYMGPEDKACHAYNNLYTERTKPIFEEGGITYIYLIYGMYNCLNIVTREKGTPHAVLIRAVEPLDEKALAFAKKNRNIKSKKIVDLTNGPGKLCKALQIDRALNGINITEKGVLWVGEGEQVDKIVECPRINIAYAMEYVDVPWRFYIEGNPFVSVTYKED